MSIGNLKDTGNQGNNMPWQWKMLQGIQAIATATSAPLTCVDDSVTICNANIDAFTFTNIGGDDALNVNIAGGVTLEVNLDAANDQVGVYGYVSGLAGSPVPLNVNAQGQVAIQDGGNSITVDAIDLDIRDLDCATDSVSICSDGTPVGTANPLPVDVTFPAAIDVNLHDGAGTPITSTTIGATTALDVIITPTNTLLNLENLEVSGADGDLSAFGSNITSISFFSNGTANALVSVNGGSTFVNVAPGTTINLDANSPSHAYGGTSFFWDTTTNVGSSLIIIYSYI
jgi:hypothetical protein